MKRGGRGSVALNPRPRRPASDMNVWSAARRPRRRWKTAAAASLPSDSGAGSFFFAPRTDPRRARRMAITSPIQVGTPSIRFWPKRRTPLAAAMMDAIGTSMAIASRGAIRIHSCRFNQIRRQPPSRSTEQTEPLPITNERRRSKKKLKQIRRRTEIAKQQTNKRKGNTDKNKRIPCKKKRTKNRNRAEQTDY